MTVSVNRVEDETFLFNVGQQHVHEYLSLHMEQTESSYWVHYPEKYKFMSLDFDINQDIL